jgi:predicted porin
MKKSLIALAAFGAFSGSVYAGNSLMLYGLVDTDYANDTSHIIDDNLNFNRLDSTYRLSSGIMQGSHWGLRSVENLGGRLRTRKRF